MTRVERDGETFVVPASVLAEAFGLNEETIRQDMRDGRIATRCETGIDEDAGRWRFTFHRAGRACRIVVDEGGKIVKRVRFATAAGR